MEHRQGAPSFAQQQISELSAGFEDYVAAFNKNNPFSGPSLYFHHKTLQIGRNLGAVEACLGDERFFESLYATLASWGMHRMGPGNTRACFINRFGLRSGTYA